DLKKVADDVRSLNPKNEIKKALSPMEKAARDVRAGLDTAMNPTAKPQPSPEVSGAQEPAQPAEPAKAGLAAIPGEAPAKSATNGTGKPEAKSTTTAAAPKKATKRTAGTSAAKPEA